MRGRVYLSLERSKQLFIVKMTTLELNEHAGFRAETTPRETYSLRW